MSSDIVPIIPIRAHEDRQAVSGRDLHAFLGLGRDYTNWFKGMLAYGFEEGKDFTPILAESTGGRPSVDHVLTLDMAKELAMIQRTDKGKQARQYFIEVEKHARQAPRPAELSRSDLARMVLEAEAEKAELEAKITADAPKVEYVDTFVADNDLMLIRDVAKNLGLTESGLRAELVARGWIYKQHSTRWSEREQKKVPQTRYSAYSHKARYFRHVPNHEAPRFRDETMHTLKVTPQGAAAIARLIRTGESDLDGIEVTERAV